MEKLIFQIQGSKKPDVPAYKKAGSTIQPELGKRDNAP